MTGRSMIARNGIRTTLRARGRTALFTALILLLTLTLALGLGMWAYCSGTLAEMDETYTSVALLEYLGQDYPDGSVADENARQAASALDDDAIAAVSGVERWERNDRALAAMDGYLRSAGEIPYGDQAVLAVFNLIPRYDFAQLSEDQLAASYVAADFDSMSCRIHVSGLLGGDAEVPLYTSSKASEAVEDTYVVVTYFGDTTLVTPEGSIDLWSIPGIASYIHSAASDTYQSEEKVLVGYDAIVSRCLYSLEGREGIAVTMEVGDSGFVGEKGRYYLIHGQFVETGMANRTLVITDFYDGCETKPYAESSGSDDPLLRDSLFTEYARHCRMANNYISLEASDDIPALEVFQQGYLTLREGRFPAAGEKGVCVADGAMADACGLTVGDTIDLTQMTSADSDRFDLTVTDAVQTLTIVGVTTALKEYQGTVWVSGGEGGFGEPLFGYQLGRAVLDNRTARQAADALQAMAPDGVRVTLYDQGYSAAAQPLEAMESTASAVTLAAACGTLAVLVLFAYLFVGRQQETVSVLLSLGTPARGIRLWLLSGASVVAGSAAVLGTVIGAVTLRGMLRLALRAAQSLYAVDQRYSQAAVGMALERSDEMAAPVWPALAAGGVVLVLALALCLAFLRQARQQNTPKRGRLSVRVPRDGTSVSGQGALRFAMLSARRGGWRSLVVPAAALVLSLFLGLLTATAEGWSRQTDALYESSTLTGQAVSTNGRWNTGLVVPADAARTLWKSGMLSDLSASLGWHYWSADEIPRFAENSFGQERRQAWIASQPQVVALNSLTAAPAYMNSQPPAVTWLDGWDESFLSDRTWQPFYHALRPGTGGLYGDKAQTYPCIVGADYAVQRDLAPGDTFSVWLSWSTMNRTMESVVTLRIVGTVNQTGMAEDIYVPFGFWGDPAWLDGQEDVLASGERPDFLFTDRVQMEKYFYGTTNYGTCAFTLRSAYDLEPFRQYLAQQGFSQVRAAGANRTTLLLLDQSFTETVSALGRYITFSRILFPALFAMVGLLGFLISWLMVNGRRMEFAIMRGLGASRRRVFASFFLEQALLCLTGCVIGCGGLLFLSGGAVKWLAVLAFLLCYLIGCALSVRAVGRTNLMALLSERE